MTPVVDVEDQGEPSCPPTRDLNHLVDSQNLETPVPSTISNWTCTIGRLWALRFLSSLASKAGGRPPLQPRRTRAAFWLEGSGMVALIPRRRRASYDLRHALGRRRLGRQVTFGLALRGQFGLQGAF